MFNYLAYDRWFGCAENLKHIKQELNTDFVMAVNFGNRQKTIGE